MPPEFDNACKFVNLRTALHTFATYEGATQSQAHIKPLHWYVACLVLEGGFLPEEITPLGLSLLCGSTAQLAACLLSALRKAVKNHSWRPEDRECGCRGDKRRSWACAGGIVKGAIGAFRNLTNRMKEAVGDRTNLHITYPAMVTGLSFRYAGSPTRCSCCSRCNAAWIFTVPIAPSCRMTLQSGIAVSPWNWWSVFTMHCGS